MDEAWVDEEKKLEEEHLAWVWSRQKMTSHWWMECEEQGEVRHWIKTWIQQREDECEVQRGQQKAMQREEGMTFKRKRKEEEAETE